MKIITKKVDQLLESNRTKILHDMQNNTSTPMEAVAHLFHPYLNWDWYLIGYSMNDLEDKDYIFTLTKGYDVEFGDIFLPEILEMKIHGLPIERELSFQPIDMLELCETLKNKIRA